MLKDFVNKFYLKKEVEDKCTEVINLNFDFLKTLIVNQFIIFLMNTQLTNQYFLRSNVTPILHT